MGTKTFLGVTITKFTTVEAITSGLSDMLDKLRAHSADMEAKAENLTKELATTINEKSRAEFVAAKLSDLLGQTPNEKVDA